ncbi:rubrerythrin family protein [Thermosulfurimonas marina]|uniref:Rubrerythrin family protein n=1 Tax=Thermosulfurimonas marina TaxID=2047767 RepID=A0A6H1WTV9_9BACT|nr:rubrerythrin family protein [Thermosulfurimonas marina]QJA06584.1 rubrerythrin family protein [Thermosulfurimonas marina]
MGQTKEKLQEAFAGESQANRRYLAFAKKAEEEGFPGVARLFRAAAEAETIHALNHLRAMGGIGSTVENVQAAIHGETYEFKTMYPEMIEIAEKEGETEAKQSFFFANEAEKMHAAIFERALMYVKEGKDVPVDRLYVCPVCGYTLEGERPDKCRVCGTEGSKFIEIT